MSKNLVIVESPEKAKTIGKFLGEDYHVLSSKGHVRDIEGQGKNSIGIDFENHYQPNYVIDPTKEALLETLKKEARKADCVWLASDEDREGEAIAWHLQEVLQLKPERTKRIVFHEITKPAILDAIANPRQIDYNLVNAQQARRVLDRIVGFELSPILWRKVTTGLSAGRVQSVAVRLIVEREREIEAFEEQALYRVTADFKGLNAEGKEVVLHTELNHRFTTKSEAVAYLNECKDAPFSITAISKKPQHRSPAPPFTTSSLQQEAARKLKFPVSRTMRLAQALYEAGWITYMRTDSVNLSGLAIATAKKEIVGEYGEKYHHARQFKTSSKGAQEAHEAIRPTNMSIASAGQNNDERRLYDLIRKRALASQMADAETETTRIEVTTRTLPYTFIATGETILFDGFMRLYVQSTDDESEAGESILPVMQEGGKVEATGFVGQQTFTMAPFRYTEASLVKKLEELGIGRPSTYAAIIDTIITRKYVERGNVPGKKREFNTITIANGKMTDKKKTELYGQDNQKLLPTDLGKITNDFLVEHFPEIMSYDFTAKEEENFDYIAEGKAEWEKVVDSFYRTFHPLIKKIPSGKVDGRVLGSDPETGEPIIAKISKIGPCIQIGDAENGKPRFASLKKGQSIYTITLEEALQLFEDLKPRVVAVIDGDEVITGQGKYGPYIKYRDAYVSVPKGKDVLTLTEEDVKKLLQEKADSQKPLRSFGDIHVMQGRYGCYLKTPEGNVRLPKNTRIDQLTEEACKEIIGKKVKSEK